LILANLKNDRTFFQGLKMGKVITYILGVLIILVLISSLFSAPKNATQTDTESKMSNTACNGILVIGIASCNTSQQITTSTTTNTNDGDKGLGLGTVEILGVLTLIVFAFMAKSDGSSRARYEQPRRPQRPPPQQYRDDDYYER
jgi:hypothetical protein